MAIQCINNPLVSTNSKVIENSLVNAFSQANTDFLQLVFEVDELFRLGIAIAYDNSNHYTTPKRTVARIKAIVENKWYDAGHIKFAFQVGKSRLAPEETGTFQFNNYYVFLEHIKIEESFQGKGLASKALDVFNTSLDQLKLPSILGIDSQTIYAAQLYNKKGYEFTEKAIRWLNCWYEKLPVQERRVNELSFDKTKWAQNEYLADSNSNRMLSEKEKWPFMIRWNR